MNYIITIRFTHFRFSIAFHIDFGQLTRNATSRSWRSQLRHEKQIELWWAETRYSANVCVLRGSRWGETRKQLN